VGVLAELVYAKRFTPTTEERAALDPLAFHVRFGPPAVKLLPGDAYAVPIRPTYLQLGSELGDPVDEEGFEEM
jgi:hypothetical protein